MILFPEMLLAAERQESRAEAEQIAPGCSVITHRTGTQQFLEIFLSAKQTALTTPPNPTYLIFKSILQGLRGRHSGQTNYVKSPKTF